MKSSARVQTINVNGRKLPKDQVKEKLVNNKYKINHKLVEYAFKRRYETISKDRGYGLKWHDIFDQFLVECRLAINNQSDADCFASHIYCGKLDSKISHIYSRMTKEK